MWYAGIDWADDHIAAVALLSVPSAIGVQRALAPTRGEVAAWLAAAAPAIFVPGGAPDPVTVDDPRIEGYACGCLGARTLTV